MNAPLLLAIDPSSTATGWAIADIDRGEVNAADVIRPAAGWDARRRIMAMIDVLDELITQRQPRAVVIEMPSGRPGRGSRAGATGHLAIYGVAAGMIALAIERTVYAEAVCPVDDVVVDWTTEREWTRSVGRDKRIAMNRLRHSHIDFTRDRGGDIAEACGIAEFWLSRRPLATALARENKRRAQ